MTSVWRKRTISFAGSVAVFYLIYRGLFTLNLDGIGCAVASVCLLVGETHGLVLLSLHWFQIWDPVVTPPCPVIQDVSVDVFITTLDEQVELLEPTIRAAKSMHYPHETYILDDGDRKEVRDLALQHGVHYLRRESNVDYKAGNLNHALEHTQGDYVAIFDADHIAAPDFLNRTIGFFRESNVAFVQTPHCTANDDDILGWPDTPESTPLRWNADTVFHRLVQPGKARWNAVMFCGSAAVLRREALEEIGGFATETITEDMHTGLRLHARGWKSVFVNEPLVFGLAPRDMTSLRTQRSRWGRGNLAVLAHDNPITIPGLSLPQRIAYMASILSWTHGMARIPLYLAPVLMLSLDLPPVRLDQPWLGPVVVFYVATLWICQRSLHGPRFSILAMELSQLMTAWTDVRSCLLIAVGRSPSVFHTTDKNDHQSLPASPAQDFHQASLSQECPTNTWDIRLRPIFENVAAIREVLPQWILLFLSIHAFQQMIHQITHEPSVNWSFHLASGCIALIHAVLAWEVLERVTLRRRSDRCLASAIMVSSCFVVALLSLTYG